MKNIIIAIIAFFTIESAKSQSNEDCKYLSVLTYCRTNTDVNKKIKLFFPSLVTKKEKYVEFNVSDRIEFLDVSYFKDKLVQGHYGINEDLLANAQEYRKKFYFEPYQSELLKNLVQRNQSKLFLTFSKPVGDWLVVQLAAFDPELKRTVKFGKAMLILFKFNSVGRIEDVMYAGAAYN